MDPSGLVMTKYLSLPFSRHEVLDGHVVRHDDRMVSMSEMEFRSKEDGNAGGI